MTFYRQELLADPGRVDWDNPANLPGDCLRAAVASLTDTDPATIPHFALYGPLWWDLMRVWAHTQGADFGCLGVVEGRVRDQFTTPPDADTLLIGSGPSPRGQFRHCVLVDLDLNLVHDPHPSQAGLIRVDEVYAWCTPYDPPPPVDLITLPGATGTVPAGRAG